MKTLTVISTLLNIILCASHDEIPQGKNQNILKSLYNQPSEKSYIFPVEGTHHISSLQDNYNNDEDRIPKKSFSKTEGPIPVGDQFKPYPFLGFYSVESSKNSPQPNYSPETIPEYYSGNTLSDKLILMLTRQKDQTDKRLTTKPDEIFIPHPTIHKLPNFSSDDYNHHLLQNYNNFEVQKPQPNIEISDHLSKFILENKNNQNLHNFIMQHAGNNKNVPELLYKLILENKNRKLLQTNQNSQNYYHNKYLPDQHNLETKKLLQTDPNLVFFYQNLIKKQHQNLQNNKNKFYQNLVEEQQQSTNLPDQTDNVFVIEDQQKLSENNKQLPNYHLNLEQEQQNKDTSNDLEKLIIVQKNLGPQNTFKNNEKLPNHLNLFGQQYQYKDLPQQANKLVVQPNLDQKSQLETNQNVSNYYQNFIEEQQQNKNVSDQDYKLVSVQLNSAHQKLSENNEQLPKLIEKQNIGFPDKVDKVSFVPFNVDHQKLLEKDNTLPNHLINLVGQENKTNLSDHEDNLILVQPNLERQILLEINKQLPNHQLNSHNSDLPNQVGKLSNLNHEQYLVNKEKILNYKINVVEEQPKKDLPNQADNFMVEQQNLDHQILLENNEKFPNYEINLVGQQTTELPGQGNKIALELKSNQKQQQNTDLQPNLDDKILLEINEQLPNQQTNLFEQTTDLPVQMNKLVVQLQNNQKLPNLEQQNKDLPDQINKLVLEFQNNLKLPNYYQNLVGQQQDKDKFVMIQTNLEHQKLLENNEQLPNYHKKLIEQKQQKNGLPDLSDQVNKLIVLQPNTGYRKLFKNDEHLDVPNQVNKIILEHQGLENRKLLPTNQNLLNYHLNLKDQLYKLMEPHNNQMLPTYDQNLVGQQQEDLSNHVKKLILVLQNDQNLPVSDQSLVGQLGIHNEDIQDKLDKLILIHQNLQNRNNKHLGQFSSNQYNFFPRHLTPPTRKFLPDSDSDTDSDTDSTFGKLFTELDTRQTDTRLTDKDPSVPLNETINKFIDSEDTEAIKKLFPNFHEFLYDLKNERTKHRNIKVAEIPVWKNLPFKNFRKSAGNELESDFILTDTSEKNYIDNDKETTETKIPDYVVEFILSTPDVKRIVIPENNSVIKIITDSTDIKFRNDTEKNILVKQITPKMIEIIRIPKVNSTIVTPEPKVYLIKYELDRKDPPENSSVSTYEIIGKRENIYETTIIPETTDAKSTTNSTQTLKAALKNSSRKSSEENNYEIFKDILSIDTDASNEVIDIDTPETSILNSVKSAITTETTISITEMPLNPIKLLGIFTETPEKLSIETETALIDHEILSATTEIPETELNPETSTINPTETPNTISSNELETTITSTETSETTSLDSEISTVILAETSATTFLIPDTTLNPTTEISETTTIIPEMTSIEPKTSEIPETNPKFSVKDSLAKIDETTTINSVTETPETILTQTTIIIPETSSVISTEDSETKLESQTMSSSPENSDKFYSESLIVSTTEISEILTEEPKTLQFTTGNPLNAFFKIFENESEAPETEIQLKTLGLPTEIPELIEKETNSTTQTFTEISITDRQTTATNTENNTFEPETNVTEFKTIESVPTMTSFITFVSSKVQKMNGRKTLNPEKYSVAPTENKPYEIISTNATSKQPEVVITRRNSHIPAMKSTPEISVFPTKSKILESVETENTKSAMLDTTEKISVSEHPKTIVSTPQEELQETRVRTETIPIFLNKPESMSHIVSPSVIAETVSVTERIYKLPETQSTIPERNTMSSENIEISQKIKPQLETSNAYEILPYIPTTISELETEKNMQQSTVTTNKSGKVLVDSVEKTTFTSNELIKNTESSENISEQYVPKFEFKTQPSTEKPMLVNTEDRNTSTENTLKYEVMKDPENSEIVPKQNILESDIKQTHIITEKPELINDESNLIAEENIPEYEIIEDPEEALKEIMPESDIQELHPSTKKAQATNMEDSITYIPEYKTLAELESSVDKKTIDATDTPEYFTDSIQNLTNNLDENVPKFKIKNERSKQIMPEINQADLSTKKDPINLTVESSEKLNENKIKVDKKQTKCQEQTEEEIKLKDNIEYLPLNKQITINNQTPVNNNIPIQNLVVILYKIYNQILSNMPPIVRNKQTTKYKNSFLLKAPHAYKITPNILLNIDSDEDNSLEHEADIGIKRYVLQDLQNLLNLIRKRKNNCHCNDEKTKTYPDLNETINVICQTLKSILRHQEIGPELLKRLFNEFRLHNIFPATNKGT